MREICKSGSEGGAGQINALSLPLSPAPLPIVIQNSVFDLSFDNGANKSNSLTVGCGRKHNASNKCYHARTDPIVRWNQSSDFRELSRLDPVALLRSNTEFCHFIRIGCHRHAATNATSANPD